MADSPRPSQSPTPPPKGCTLLRDNVFDENEHLPAEQAEVLMRRQPTMLRSGNRLIAPSANADKKYTVVFDLDETVVYARDGPLYSRAYLKDLLRAIKNDFEVIVWTAGERDYAKNVLEEINDEHIIQHLIYRHRKWFKEEDYTKDLKKLGRDMDYTIMVENTPDCVRANPQNGIIVEDFEVVQQESVSADAEANDTATTAPETSSKAAAPSDKEKEGSGEVNPTDPLTPTVPIPAEQLELSQSKIRRQHTDRTLYLLKEVLLSLVKSGKTVPDFLASCDLLTKETVVGSDEREIPIYHLGMRRRRKDAGTPRKTVKENRDLVRISARSRTATPQPPPLAAADEEARGVEVGGSKKRSRAETNEAENETSLTDLLSSSKEKVEDLKADAVQQM